MKKLLVVSLSLISYAAFSHFQPVTAAKAIYGNDNRSYALNGVSYPMEHFANATAVIADARSLSEEFGGLLYWAVKRPLNSVVNLCSGEPYEEEVSFGTCSGFLIGKDLLLTAGHCVSDQFSCENKKFVFNYQKNSLLEDKAKIYFLPNNIYSCKELVARKGKTRENPTEKLDYAIIRLDREVEDRFPLKFRHEGVVDPTTPVVLIGHPYGLPMMFVDHAEVKSSNDPYIFTANLDSFKGNSGSPVINEQTGLVEGMIVGGQNDIVFDLMKRCYKFAKYEDDSPRGESVLKLTAIPELK